MKEMYPMAHQRSRQPQKIFMEKVLCPIFAPKITLYGKQNLKCVEEIAHKGIAIVFMANHLSHADYPVLDQALKRHGFKEIADRTIPLQGLRVQDGFVRKLLLPAYNTIRVWPPTIEPKNKKEALEQLRMHREALEYARQDLKNGYHLFIFPEGTRSKTGTLLQGHPEVTHFLDQVNNTFVVPVGIYGTEKMLAPGKPFPIPCPTNIIFGTPISVDGLKKGLDHLQNKEMRREMIDFIMIEIAKLLPQQYKGVYG